MQFSNIIIIVVALVVTYFITRNQTRMLRPHP